MKHFFALTKKHTLASLLLLASASPALAQGTELFISEYDEGAHMNGVTCPGQPQPSLGTEKAIEIYNPTTSTVSLAAYSLRRYANGSLYPTEDERLMRTTGVNTLAPGAAFVIAHPDATNTEILAAKDQTASIRNSGPNATVLIGGGPILFNGDDALALVRWSSGVAGQGNPIIVDIFGIIGHHPTSPSGAGFWTATDVNGVFTSSGNQSLIRRAGISGGNVSWNLNTSPALDPTLFDISLAWQMYSAAFPVGGPADPCAQSYANLGNHVYTGPTGPYAPVIAAPAITAFSPATGPVGTTVTVTGQNLTGTTSVRFGPVGATGVTVNAAGTQLTCTVPFGARYAPVIVTTPGGVVTSPTSFCPRYTPTATSAVRCGPGSLALTAAGAPAPTATSYAWYTTATGGSPIAGVTGPTYDTPSLSATTTYYVAILLDAAACGGPRVPVQATISPVPTPTISVNGPTTLCPGGFVTLTAAGGGTYQWNTGETTPSITVSAAGTYTVAATSAVGCSGVSAPISVTSLPVPNPAFAYASPRACAGTATVLTPTLAAGATAGTFAVSPATGLLLNPTTGTIQLASATPGTYLITNTVAAGVCAPVVGAASLTVLAPPVASLTATGPTTLCAGDSVQLLAGAVPGATYLWNTGATTPILTVRNAGSYSVTVTTIAGCAATSAPLSVTTQPTPAAPTVVATPQPAGTVLLTSSTPIGNQWFFNGVPIPGATGGTYVVGVGQNGTYTVVATAPGGCPSAPSAPMVLVVTGTSLNIAAAALALYPNPAHDAVRVQGGKASAPVHVLDAVGRTVLTSATDATGTATLDVARLPKGVYVVRTDARAARLVVE